MATIRQQPDPLSVIGYPNSDLVLRFLKSGFPANAALSARIWTGKGDQIAETLDNAIQPTVLTPTAEQSTLKIAGAATAKFKAADYTLEILIEGVVHAAGPIRFSRETTTEDPDTEAVSFERGGEQLLVLRPTGSGEAKYVPFSAGVAGGGTVAGNRVFNHGLNCDAFIGRCFTAAGGEIEGPKLYPIDGEADYPIRNWAYLDDGGYDTGLIAYVGFFPLYR